MGEVFAALDQSTGARIALKRMRGGDKQQRALRVHFMREYHALSELRHPRIIAVHDYGVDRDQPYYTMELLDGQDLRELSPVPWREACRYLRDVASSLALLHARRLLHRDVSPRNVRRTSDGRCKLLDFGAMVPFGVPPNLTGTPPCIAPEALQGGPLDQRTDLYSLGALAYFTLTGRHAFPVSEIALLPRAWKQPLARPRQVVRDVPDALDELVMALLSMDPMKRPSSAAEVIDRLAAAGELEAENETATARSFLAGSALVGRDAQCEQLRRQLTKSLDGRGSALLVQGEPGSGRSRILAEAALLGQTCGLTVVRAVARAQRGAVPGLFGDLVQGLLQAAPAEAARARASRPLIGSLSFGADSPDARVAVLDALTGFVADVARERPLLITIDDLDRADELSGALAAALAFQTSTCSLTLIASYDSRHAAPVLANVPGLAETIALAPIDHSQTLQLTESVFGDVPNLERLSDWLFRIANGNPKLTLELAEHLLAQGIVRYVDGTWVLPAEIEQALPPSAAETLLLRLERLSSEARALAELLSVSRAGTSAERILDLAQQPAAAAFGALEELVRAGVLEAAGDQYVFAQDALRESVSASLDPLRRRELHAAWAERLLQGSPDRDEQLEAGWHLIHTAQELRGAQLLAKIGPELIERRANMASAVPALERALEVYERRGQPLAERLRLRSLLVMSSFLFDHRLAARYAESTLDALYPHTGLVDAERVSGVLGKRIGFVAGVVWATLRWLFRSPARRGPSVPNALKYYARAVMGLMGQRALAIDVAGLRAGFARLRMVEHSPHPTLKVVYSLAKAITLHNQGRGAEIGALIQRVIRQVGKRRWLQFQMSEAERIDLLAGVLMLEGINECYRERSSALSYAQRLEQLGTPLATAASLRISMIYHLLRGERERTQHYRRLLDLSAIQNGTAWQIDWIAVPIEGLAGATWTDLVAMRRSLDALEKLIVEVPSFVNMRDTIRISYHFRRGDHAAAVKYGEEYITAHPPFTLIGWAITYAKTAFAHLELGNARRALEICENALAVVTDEHKKYVVQHTTLEAAHATALAVSGQRERAEAVFHELMARLRASGEHTRALLMHEYRVKVARLLGDRAGLLAALQDMREAALASGNPSAILLADRTHELARRRNSPLPAASGEPGSSAMTTRAEETAVTVFLRQERGLARRAQHALHMLGQYSSTGEAYLYCVNARGLELAASLDRRDPPAGLEQLLAALSADAGLTRRTITLSGELTYTVVGLSNASATCVGVAALREGEGPATAAIPDALLSDIGRALESAQSGVDERERSSR